MINTHHLGHMIEAFIQEQGYGIPVSTTFEPTLLDTGGAIKNVQGFWEGKPFMVINGDVFTNIDLQAVYAFHLSHKHPVTMVLHDHEVFNNVWVDAKHCIRGFGIDQPCPPSHGTSANRSPLQTQSPALRRLAFTGIQIVDPQVLETIPPGIPCSIIDIYCQLINRGAVLKGFLSKNHFWHDIGTMEGYREAAKEALVRQALDHVCPGVGEKQLVWTKLKGDGSDRTWHRGAVGSSSAILVDHGPPPNNGTCEADSFNAIGNHLHKRGIPVPEIFGYDRPLGLIALEDLGDIHLQTAVLQSQKPSRVFDHYKRVIDMLVPMGIDGAKGFEPTFTYQTPTYSQDLILEKEANYFCDAFLRGFMGMDTGLEKLKPEFDVFAQKGLDEIYFGFLHRDFQSRNILVSEGEYYVIDFQGGRLGPLQYDLASLLIDPYVALPESLQEDLIGYYLEVLSTRMPVDAARFVNTYRYCVINRNLQILGAFAFLGKVKEKKSFLNYIPTALTSLKTNMRKIEPRYCQRLQRIVESL
jgi:aminoglycoside/choline kinase family phosphotransferase